MKIFGYEIFPKDGGLKIGDKYILKDNVGNPFVTNYYVIKDIQNGFVQFEYIDGSYHGGHSSYKTFIFKQFFKKID